MTKCFKQRELVGDGPFVSDKQPQKASGQSSPGYQDSVPSISLVIHLFK
jgi:hypothetical protein